MHRLLNTYREKVNGPILAFQCLALYVLVLFWTAVGYVSNIAFFVQNSFIAALMSVFLCTYFVYRYTTDKGTDIKRVLFSYFHFLLVFALLLLTSVFIWDNSHDGQTYHLQAIHELINGWNPFRTFLGNEIPNAVYINHYAKAFEIFGSSITQFTGMFETSKVSNLLVALAAWLLTFSYLKKHLNLHHRKAFIYSSLLILNPIISTQLFAFMFDGQVASLFLILIIGFLLIAKQQKLGYWLWLTGILLLASLKFTGLVYVCLFVPAGLGYLLYSRNKPLVRRFLLINILGMIAGIFIAANPYYTNISSGHHIFHPLMGKEAINIMVGANAPKSFDTKNRVQKFIIANSSKSSNVHGSSVTPEPELKLPYQVTLKEWTVFKSVSVLYGGMGPLFWAILILSVILLLLLVIYRVPLPRAFIFLLAFITISIFIIPECWLSRYVPQLWYLPILLIVFYESQAKKVSAIRILKTVNLGLIGINGIFILGIAVGSNLIISQQMRNEYVWLQKMRTPVKVIPNDFISTAYRLDAYHIPYTNVPASDTSAQKYLQFKPICSSSIILLNEQTPPYTPGTFFKFLESYVKQEKSH
ncbi:hypothetical protein DBR32_13425 [Taibaiella sp. KBW10]|uniref:hypothetical protein n=1 Tax=Taibaiella sp. KBW10 TaxID=2153357 RepID=UPI000F5A02D9|nr:hypothetical protein [Taibaiella sp. KBW10]RQO30553.1 hypothetical protein DBR32_13425 [Taibaiella sp. KBW10]